VAGKPEAAPAQPSAEPTKEFFVDMLTKDIPLDQAVLDLVDNCVDGAKKIAAEGGQFGDHTVNLEIYNSHFRILDDCGAAQISLHRSAGQFDSGRNLSRFSIQS
jgi:hypothetical protein